MLQLRFFKFGRQTMSTHSHADYNFLGMTGLRVSNMCLGTNLFGTSEENPLAMFSSNPKHHSEEASHRLLDRFVELGGNFIDTADVYDKGGAERIIGKWLKKKNRSDIIISSKLWFPMDWKTQNRIGLSRQHILRSCEESLERLQTDYIDLYQAHMWDNASAIEDILRTFDDLVRSGKIRYYGFCNVCGWQLQKIIDTAKLLNLHPCVSLQQQYNLLSRESELEPFMVCANEGLGVLTWSPLKGGLLSGKFKRDQQPDATRSRVGHLKARKSKGELVESSWDRYSNDEGYWTLIALLEKISKSKGKTVAQIAIRWLIQKEFVASVIIGCSSMEQLEDNMGASSGWELTQEEMKELDEMTSPTKPYPYSLIWSRATASRNNKFTTNRSLHT